MSESDTQQNEFAEPRTSSGLRGVNLNDDGSVLHAALSQLSNSEREMIRLKFQDNQNYKKISQYLGVSTNVVAKALHKILLKLKFVLAGGQLADFEDKTTSRKFDKHHPKFTAYALGEVSEDDRRKGKDYLGRHPELRRDIEDLRTLGKAIIAELEINPFPKLKKPFKISFAKIQNELTSFFQKHPGPSMAGAGLVVVLLMVSMYQLGQSSKNEFIEISKPLASGDKKPSGDENASGDEKPAAAEDTPAEPAPAVAKVAPIAAKPAPAATVQTPVVAQKSVQQKVPVTQAAAIQPKPVVQAKVAAVVPKSPVQQNTAGVQQQSVPQQVVKPVATVVAAAKPAPALTSPVASTPPAAVAPVVEKKPEAVVQAVSAAQPTAAAQPVAQVAAKPVVAEAPAKPVVASAPVSKPAPAKPAGVNLSALSLGTNNLLSKSSGPKFQGTVATNSPNRVGANDDLKVGDAKQDLAMPEGEPKVTGGLTSQDVSTVLRANANQSRECFQDLLKRAPGAKGKVVVDFIISADGRVTKAAVSNSTINDAMVRGCLTVKLKSWKFPKSSDGKSVKVQYPFTVSAG